MTRSSGSPSGGEKAAKRDSFSIPILIFSIALAIFAVVTQLLTATGAISLSPTLQLTMWLVAAGLIVLLWIVYMAMQAQTRLSKALEETAAAVQAAEAARKAAQEREERAAEAKRAAEEQMAAVRRRRDDTGASAESRATAEAEYRDAWVPPDELRRLDGLRQSVTTADVFPDGCYLYSIRGAQDHDEETDIGGLVDISPPRRRMYRCAVVDLNPTLKDRPHDATVDVLTDQEPSPPPGLRHPLVEFDGLTITPYVTDQGPIWIGYALSATGITFVAGEAQAAS